MGTNELISVTYVIIAFFYFVMGLLAINQKRFPLFGNKAVIGQQAVTIGYVLTGTGILILITVFYQATLVSAGQRVSYFIPSLILFISTVIIFWLRPKSRLVNVEDSKRKHQPLPDVLTVSEAARYLRVEEVYVLHLIEDGELNAKAIGGDYRISKAELQKFLQS